MEVSILCLRVSLRDEFLRVFAQGIFVSKVSEVDFEFTGAPEEHITPFTMQTLGVWWRA